MKKNRVIKFYNKITQLVSAGILNQASLSPKHVHFKQWSRSLEKHIQKMGEK